MKEKLILKKHEDANFKAKSSNLKSFKGITLIALVVTIIVLVILATISIYAVLGKNGIIKKARDVAEKNKIEEARSKLDLSIADWQVVKKTEEKTFERHLKETFGDENVTPNEESFNVKIDGYTFTVKDDEVGEEDNLGQEFAYLFEVNDDGVISINRRYTYYEENVGTHVLDMDGNYIELRQIIIPSKVNGKKVTSISSSIFGVDGFAYLENIIIPSGVTSIARYAFSRSPQLAQYNDSRWCN